MSACRRWNEKEAADKIWTNYKIHVAALRSQHKQVQGESSASSGYHATNESLGQTENQMDKATIGALTNLATATPADCGIVANLVDANARLSRKLEELSKEFKEVNALLKKEHADIRGQIPFTYSSENYCWYHLYKVAMSHTSQSLNFFKDGGKYEVTKANIMGRCKTNKECRVGAIAINNSEKFEYYRTPPLFGHNETSIVDSGCPGYFFLNNAPYRNKNISQNTLRVMFANGETMDSTLTSSLYIPELSEADIMWSMFFLTWQTILCFQWVKCVVRAITSLSELTGSQFTIPQTRPFAKDNGTCTRDYGASTCALTSISSPLLQLMILMNYITQVR
jgi:hypothetical protein